MRIYIDDGSTHIKMLWEQHGRTFTHLSPNSFKRGWSATFGSGKPFNYTAGKEKYSFDLISPDNCYRTTTSGNEAIQQQCFGNESRGFSARVKYYIVTQ